MIDVVGQLNRNPVKIDGKIALPPRFEVENLDLPLELHASVLGLEADATGSISGSARAPAIDFSLQAEAASLKPMQEVFGAVIPEVKSVKLMVDIKGDQGQPVSGKLNASAGETRLDAELNLQRQGQRPKLTGTVSISDVDVLRLWAPLFADQPEGAAVKETRSPASSSPQQVDQPLELAWLDSFLEGQGRSVAQIMATLNGNVHLLMEQGSADAKGLDLFVGGLGAMFGTIFIDQSSKTKIECAISDLKFDQGILTPRLAVLDTQYSTVFVGGLVDLKQELLDLSVSPNAKGVTLSVAFPVRVKGTLSQPNVDVEKTGAPPTTGDVTDEGVEVDADKTETDELDDPDLFMDY